MAFEEVTNLAWYLIMALAVVMVMIGFFLFFRPGVQGGWFTGLASVFRWFLKPPV